VTGEWVVERHRGSAAGLHALDWPEPVVPTVWRLEVDGPALVLGSTQDAGTVDTDRLAAAGIALARRRSGGGAVLLEAGRSVWIDVLVPRDDPRWVDDVGRSFTWLGEAWVAALADLGVDRDGELVVHAGALRCGRFGKQVCFAGIGPGEVTLDGVKLVGLSQRRTRAGARFQCVVHRAWHPAPLVAIAGVEPGDLPPVAVVDRTADAVGSALLAHLG
jgi:lipoate-protein ligase A